MPAASLAERGLQDPRGTFATPEAVTQSKELRPEEKRQILERWRKLGGSPGGEEAPDLMTRILRALAYLDTETGTHKDIEGQGLYGAIGDIGKEPQSKPH